MDVAIQMIKIYQDNYPEILRKIFVINGGCE